jgi:hypothetical protein
MKTGMIILTGAMLSFTAFAWQSDPMAEERYKLKHGRYTSAEELRQKALKEARGRAPEESHVAACCRKINAALKNSGRETFADERFRAKYGRSAPATEAHEAREAEVAAAHISKCVELGKCSMKRAEAISKPAPKESWRESWLRAKYGRSTPVKTDEPHVFASANHAGCEHECCKQAD